MAVNSSNTVTTNLTRGDTILEAFRERERQILIGLIGIFTLFWITTKQRSCMIRGYILSDYVVSVYIGFSKNNIIIIVIDKRNGMKSSIPLPKK